MNEGCLEGTIDWLQIEMPCGLRDLPSQILSFSFILSVVLSYLSAKDLSVGVHAWADTLAL